MEESKRRLEEMNKKTVEVWQKKYAEKETELQRRLQENQISRNQMESDFRAKIEKLQGKLEDQERGHQEHLEMIGKEVEDKFESIERMREEYDQQWREINKMKEDELKKLGAMCDGLKEDLEKERAKTERLVRDMREQRRKQRQELHALKKTKERETRAMASRMTRDEADVEMMATMVAGSVEEGRFSPFFSRWFFPYEFLIFIYVFFIFYFSFILFIPVLIFSFIFSLSCFLFSFSFYSSYKKRKENSGGSGDSRGTQLCQWYTCAGFGVVPLPASLGRDQLQSGTKASSNRIALHKRRRKRRRRGKRHLGLPTTFFPCLLHHQLPQGSPAEREDGQLASLLLPRELCCPVAPMLQG